MMKKIEKEKIEWANNFLKMLANTKDSKKTTTFIIWMLENDNVDEVTEAYKFYKSYKKQVDNFTFNQMVKN